jgi:hypothetical protein
VPRKGGDAVIVMQLHCPICHYPSGNSLTCDWPEPLQRKQYDNLICTECGRDFSFCIDDTGMRSLYFNRGDELADFMDRRRRRGVKAGS